jgi:hypothetical protein
MPALAAPLRRFEQIFGLGDLKNPPEGLLSRLCRVIVAEKW